MRLKGINPIEQHVEKVVAGVFGLALLGVLAMQFLGKPPSVKVGTEDVQPIFAYDKVASAAKRVDDKIKSPNPSGLPSPEEAKSVTHAFEHFSEKLTAPVSPNPQLAAALDKATDIASSGVGATGSANTSVAELAVPAPTHAVAATNMSTIATSEQQLPDVAKVLPPAPPFDKASVSVEAVFDGTALKAALTATPTGDIRPIPPNWYASGMQILGVELHRQTQNQDGTWSAEEKVKQMPGRTLYVDTADKLNDAASLNAAAKVASDQAAMIRRTPYYTAAVGDEWFPPSERESAVAGSQTKAAAVKLAQETLKRDEATKKRLEDEMAKVGQSPQPSGGGGGGGGGGHGRMGGGGGGGAPPPPAGPNSGDDARRKQLQHAIERADANIAKDKDELRKLGEKIEGDTDAQQTDPNAKPQPEPAVLDSDNIKIWAHDVFVERGKTYRYQVVVLLNNPYFGHSAAMIPAQAEKLAKFGVIRSAPSDWTQPVTVDPETYLFFTSATQDNPLNGQAASARAEVFQFKWGYWRRGAVTLEPGDTVAAEIRVPDFAKIIAAKPVDPNEPQAPTTGGGGHMRGGISAPPPPSQATPAMAPGTPPPMILLPTDTKSAPVMIGVGAGQIRDSNGTSSKTAEQVYIREPDGDIKILVPDVQKQDPAYVRVSHSAERGIRDLMPPAEKPRPMPGQQPNTPDSGPRPGGQGSHGG